MAVSKQQSEVITIPRSKIKNAPYNPRIMSEEARSRLKKGIKRFGLASTLTWNRRTGNLVSGHQRLKQLDEIENTKDYELLVSVVDLSEKDEMALNVQMNNTSMMGEFDFDALNDMVSQGVEINDLGFSEADIDILFGDGLNAEPFQDVDEVKEAKGTLKSIKEDRSEFMKKMKEQNDANYYFMVVCESSDQRAELFKKMGVPFSEEVVPANLLPRLDRRVLD